MIVRLSTNQRRDDPASAAKPAADPTCFTDACSHIPHLPHAERALIPRYGVWDGVDDADDDAADSDMDDDAADSDMDDDAAEGTIDSPYLLHQ